VGWHRRLHRISFEIEDYAFDLLSASPPANFVPRVRAIIPRKHGRLVAFAGSATYLTVICRHDDVGGVVQVAAAT
jgi:hypothetical protein